MLFYRFLPDKRPKEAGDLATFGGTLQALAVRGRPNFDANTGQARRDLPRRVGHGRGAPTRSPTPSGPRRRARARPSSTALRASGPLADRVYFDCTTGGEAQLGQLWEFRPRGGWGGDLKLIYESEAAEDLEDPDNLVVVPHSGDVFLPGRLRRRAVRPRRHHPRHGSTTSPAPSLTAPSSAAGALAPTDEPSSSTSRATG